MKCRFKRKCKQFREESVTCMYNGGMYYEDLSRPAGCYRQMESKINEI